MKNYFPFFVSILFCAFSNSTVVFAQNVGVGTSNPDSKLHIEATLLDSVAFKVNHNGQSKLKVSRDGGVSVGSNSNAPNNGLSVAGVIEPGDSIRSSVKPIYITSVNDSVVLESGGTRIILLAGGAVKIIASGSGGITINGGNGDVNITGINVNIKATANAKIDAVNTTVSAISTATISGNSTLVKGTSVTNVQGNPVRIGSGSGTYSEAARKGDAVYVDGFVGTIFTGSPKVLIE